MLGNPLAADIHRVFEEIYNSRSTMYSYDGDKKSRIQHFKRTSRFVGAINCFFLKCGLKPFMMIGTEVDEKKLLNFALQLSGYIRDSQDSLDKLSDSYARDPDIIKLYRSAANYTVACNGKIPGSKYRFEHNKDYCFWHIDNPQDLSNSDFTPVSQPISPNRHTLILAMPFHIKPQTEELRKWSYEYMYNIFKNKGFGRDVDIYLAHFPIEQPRGEKFVLTLKTITKDENYFEPMDMKFVSTNLSQFIARDLKLDASGNVISAQPYTKEQLANNFRNLNFLGYCAGGAHTHRWINAIYHIGKQIYPQEELESAMQNIFVASYAYLPSHQHNLYSGIHFMSNYADDTMRKEPFIKMFNPEMYEEVKYRDSIGGAKITVMPDGRNWVVASPLPQNLIVIGKNSKLQQIPNQENGHHIAFMTATNFGGEDNFANRMFTNVLANAVSGRRGNDVMASSTFQSPDDIIRNAAIMGRRSYYRC